MRTRFLIIAIAGVLATGLAVATGAPEQQASQLRIDEVQEGLYNIVGSGGNVAALVTNEGVVLIDDKFEENFEAIVESVESVTDQPIKYVINTHYHADHSGGNSRFLAVAEVISTRNARTNILEQKQSNAPPGVVPARIVFTEEASLFLGGQEVRARHFGRGHTDSDAIVYFPAQRTVHMGDMMAGNTPLIDYNGGGSIVDWTSSVDQMLEEFDFDTVIPGHGAVTDPAGLQAYRDNVETLRERVTGLIRDGREQEEIRQILEAEYAAYTPDSLHTQWGLPGFMTELR